MSNRVEMDRGQTTTSLTVSGPTVVRKGLSDVPEETLTQFKHLITFQPGGKSFQLTQAFQNALLDAENLIAQYHASQTAANMQTGALRAGRRRQ